MAEQYPDSAPVLAALQDTELCKTLLDQVGEGLYVVDRKRRILYWNQGAQEITGYMEHEVVGQFCNGDLLMHCDTAGSILCGAACPLAKTMEDGTARNCSIFLRHRHGHRLPVRVRAIPLRDASGEIVGAIEMFQPANPARDQSGALHAFGCMDPLTGLPNRAYAELLVQQAVAAWERFEVPFGWIRFDLDGSEDLSRRYGHGALQAVLLLIARTLAANLGPYDILSYWGDAEFRVGTHFSFGEDLEEFARLLAVLVRLSNVEWWGNPLAITVSIGVAMAKLGDTIESLEARTQESIFKGSGS